MSVPVNQFEQLKLLKSKMKSMSITPAIRHTSIDSSNPTGVVEQEKPTEESKNENIENSDEHVVQQHASTTKSSFVDVYIPVGEDLPVGSSKPSRTPRKPIIMQNFEKSKISRPHNGQSLDSAMQMGDNSATTGTSSSNSTKSQKARPSSHSGFRTPSKNKTKSPEKAEPKERMAVTLKNKVPLNRKKQQTNAKKLSGKLTPVRQPPLPEHPSITSPPPQQTVPSTESEFSAHFHEDTALVDTVPTKTKTVLSWRCQECNNDCVVIREECRCMCGHRLKEHAGGHKCSAPKCKCKSFYYIVAEGAWIIRCRCKHKHTEHDPNGTHQCTKFNCKCTGFHSPFVCNCNHPWHMHVQTRTEVQRVPISQLMMHDADVGDPNRIKRGVDGGEL